MVTRSKSSSLCLSRTKEKQRVRIYARVAPFNRVRRQRNSLENKLRSYNGLKVVIRVIFDLDSFYRSTLRTQLPGQFTAVSATVQKLSALGRFFDKKEKKKEKSATNKRLKYDSISPVRSPIRLPGLRAAGE